MDMQEVLSRVITRTNEIFEAEAGSVSLLEPSGQALVIRAAVGAGADAVRGLSLPADQGVIGWVVTHEKPALIADVRRDERFYKNFDEHSGFNTRSIMCVPLQVNGRTIGAIELMNMRSDYLSDTGLKIFSVVADHAALAIEHARLFDEIRVAEAKYRDLFDNANDFIFTLNGNFKISSANKMVLKTTGYRLDEIVGLPVQQFIVAEQLPRLYRLLKARLASNSLIDTFELPVLGKTGQEILLEVTLRVQRAGARPVGIHCIARDITHRRELEQRLQQTEKLSAMGQLVAGVAHELNNPLTSIMGYTDLLQHSNLPLAVNADLNMIFRQAQRAQVIIKDMLTFSRNFELKAKPVDLNEVASGSLFLMKAQLQTRQVQVKTRFDFGLPPLMADPHLLEQVFINLITNAIHALADTPDPRQLIIETRQMGTHLQLSFADNGPGIPENILKRIFDPFFSTKRVGEGTGLGLSICFGIISQHQGRIWAENNPAGGAVFYIELPLEKAIGQLAVTPVAAPIAATSPASLAILVVDDESTLLKLLERVLTPRGHLVETALDGRSALQKFTTRSFDLVICDILMPDILGTDLYRQAIKTWPYLTDRFIFITGNVVDLETRSFLDTSGLPWLSKPFLPSDVEKLIARLAANLKPVELLAD